MKKLTILIVALAMALVLGGAAWAGLNDGLIAYWSFDQCDATDDTGTGFNGTLYGNPSCEDGVEGKALFIDPVNDYIKFSGALGPNNIRAFSFFINSKGPNDLNRAGYVIGKYNWHGERSFRIESYRGDSSRIAVHFYERGDAYDGDGVSSYYEDPGSLDPTKYTIINNTPLETNAWKHVVVNITDTEIEIWIDGSITNKVKRDYQQYFHSGEPVYIGNLFNIGPDFTFNYRLNGTLDEFRIYNRPLAEAEIQQLYGHNLSIATISVPATKLGDFSSFQFEALYGNPPYSWSISDGALPAGIDLSVDGTLSGTPTKAGQFTFIVRVTDGNGDFAEKQFSLDVLLTLPPPDIRINKASTLAVPGRTLEYFTIVENVGNITVENVTIVEFLDIGLSVIDANPTPENDPTTDPVIVWNLSSLAPGTAKLLSHKSQLSGSTPLGDDIGRPACNADDLREIAACIDNISQNWATVFCGTTCGSIPAACLWQPNPYWIITCPATLGGCFWCVHGLSQDLEDQVLDCARKQGCELPENWTIGPLDPNEKVVIAKQFIQPDQLLVYPIHFENIGDVEALNVFVTDVLDVNLDASTLEILSPDGASFNPATRTVRWDLIGRNLQPGETDNALISIRPLPGLPSGTEIRNSAEIQFEVFEPITTNEVVNIIDHIKPIAMMDPLPTETRTLEFEISWAGTDAVGEIDTYSVFVSVDGGPFTPFIEKTRDTNATFSGEPGKTYGFICIATDTAGNIEVQKAVAEVMTEVVVTEVEVHVDIKPGSCPNPLNVKGEGVLPVAVLGTADFDVVQVDIATLQIEGVAPLRSAYEDATTPFDPATGKEDCFKDCTHEGPDGFLDLTLKFSAQEIVGTLGDVEDRECRVLKLTGTLIDGTPIVGEDVVLILKKK
jgi:uncharacterized repeat protein (TIGR01451 family)